MRHIVVYSYIYVDRELCRRMYYHDREHYDDLFYDDVMTCIDSELQSSRFDSDSFSSMHVESVCDV